MDKLMHVSGMKRVDELIHSGAWRVSKLMKKVVGWVDKLILCGGVGRVDKLARRLHGES